MKKEGKHNSFEGCLLVEKKGEDQECHSLILEEKILLLFPLVYVRFIDEVVVAVVAVVGGGFWF